MRASADSAVWPEGVRSRATTRLPSSGLLRSDRMRKPSALATWRDSRVRPSAVISYWRYFCPDGRAGAGGGTVPGGLRGFRA
ncbi:hypothetical protein CNY89_13705 [Amaricoccus sp. HAR-UPW-R2A-40]|nr:hypothetical protein CNY89_13705 [Amaricoccus sp. HAR-UPW-R2A-40]